MPSVEKVALHPCGFSAGLQGWDGFSSPSASREMVAQLACQGTGDHWRLYACCLAGVDSTSFISSTEVVTVFTAVWAEGICVLSNGFIPLQPSPFIFGSNPCWEEP